MALRFTMCSAALCFGRSALGSDAAAETRLVVAEKHAAWTVAKGAGDVPYGCFYQWGYPK